MSEAYFAIGTTLANMVNVETLIDPPQVLDGGRIPSLPGVKTRSLDAVPHLDGFINSRWIIDVPTDAQRIAFNTAGFGDQVTAGRRVFISSLGDDGHYNPYSVVMDRPLEAIDYALTHGGVYVRGVMVGLYDCLIQSATKTANFTVTTSTHLLYADTASGSITFALPAISGVPQNVVYSFVKTNASNNMVLDPNGAETIDGASTKTTTALNARVDIINNGTQWVSI
jgi:hypothetical protein